VETNQVQLGDHFGAVGASAVILVAAFIEQLKIRVLPRPRIATTAFATVGDLVLFLQAAKLN
jgi:hypothetical protein